MKNKKLIAAIVAMTMSATAAMSITGCSVHEHDYDWTLTTPPTCTSEGVLTGVCPDDGHTITTTVAPTAHKYGKWIIAAPSSTKKGSATKICADGDHPLVVELPETTSSAYTKSVTKNAGVAKNGETTYTLANDAGDISFTVADVPATGVKTTADVITAVVEKSVDVRSGNINTNSEDGYTFDYEFGDNYAHVNEINWVHGQGGDGWSGSEYFVTQNDDGSVLSVVREIANEYFDVEDLSGVPETSKYSVHLPNTEDDKTKALSFLSGYSVSLPQEFCSSKDPDGKDTSLTFTNIEGLLSWLYSKGSGDNLSLTYDDATKTYTLNVSYVVEAAARSNKLDADGKRVTEKVYPYPDESPEYYYEENVYEYIDVLCVAKVDFKVDADYVLTDFDFNVKNYPATTQKLKDGSTDAYDAVSNYSLEGGKYKLADTAPVDGTYFITATQVAKTDYNTPAPTMYTPDLMLVKDFKLHKVDSEVRDIIDFFGDPATETVYFNGDPIVDPVGTGVVANTGEALMIGLGSLAPVIAQPNLNDVVVSLVNADGTKTPLSSHSWDDEDYSGIYGWFSSADSFVRIRSYQFVGEKMLSISVNGIEKLLKVTFEAMGPESMSVTSSVYNETTGDYADNPNPAVSIFADQSLTVKVATSAAANCVADDSVNVTITSDNADKASVAKDGENYVFSATEAGDYEITVKSVKGDLTSTLNVHVDAVPEVSTILTGELANKKSGYTVTFGEENKVTIKIDEYTTTFDYAYNAADKSVTLSNATGSPELTAANVKLSINPLYHVVLSYGSPVSVDYVMTDANAATPIEEAIVGTVLSATQAGKGTVYVVFISGTQGIVTTNKNDTGATGSNYVFDYTLTDNGDGTYSLTSTSGSAFNASMGVSWFDTYFAPSGTINYDGTTVTGGTFNEVLDNGDGTYGNVDFSVDA